VSLLRRISAFLLLAVWLTATQHCALEAADLWFSQNAVNADSCCAETGQPCSHDGCKVVEGDSISSSSHSVKVPVPALQADTLLLCIQLIAASAITDSSSEFVEGIEQPLDWVPTWHFERRAAPSPRAPSLIQA
jgi:hypothetical protein